MDRSTVSKRCVLFLFGYEPLGTDHARARLAREFERSARTWNATTRIAESTLSADGCVLATRVRTEGPNWAVDTDFRLLHWGDMVQSDFARPHIRRLAGGLAALADFIATGTAGRYFRTNWRYGAFFCFPLVLMALFALCALGAGRSAARALDWPAAAGLPLALLLFYGLTLWPGRSLYLAYLLDDWMFARDYARGSRKPLDARLERFARELAAVMRDSDADEIIVCGHSLGAALSIDVLSRARCMESGEAARRPLVLLSTGSSLLKVALHPAAEGLRRAVATVADAEEIDWVEYQSVVDIISFYKVDPVAAIGLPARGKPRIGSLRIRAMLDAATYRRFRFDFFRLHRQLVMGNDRRHFYDFFMICCGPLTLDLRVRDPDRAQSAFAADGALLTDETGQGEGATCAPKGAS